MKSYSVLIGSRNASGHFARDDEKLIQEITARHFPEGFTILVADGGWYDASAKVFRREAAREILVCTQHGRRTGAWCRELAQALGQKEILLIESGTAKRFRLRQ